MKILGAVLAGGRSSRFGSDKAVALHRGRPLIEHALAALRHFCPSSIIVGRETPLAACVPDWPSPGLGPLGAIAGALRHARANGFDHVLTVPVDCVTLPDDLLAKLGDAPAYLTAQPVIGLWPASALAAIEAALHGDGSRSVRGFAEAIGARPVTGVVTININTPAALAAIEPCAATISFADAQAILAMNAVPLSIETVPLAKAGRRVLAEDVIARIEAPRRDVAAMDGFAVSSATLHAGRRDFAIAGASYPGEPFTGTPAPDDAVRIMTGASLPVPLDQVLPIELVDVRGDCVSIVGEVPSRAHVRTRASDIGVGARMLKAGEMLDPRALLVAAAADLAAFRVWTRPRVSILASGDELVAPGSATDTADAIPDSLSEAMLLLARQWGAKPLAARRVADDAAQIAEAAAALAGDSDVLVMVGGASRGDRDLARSALKPLGLEIGFSGVAMKPGKPAWYGRIGGCHVLGLPGNPTAAFTVARLFLAPLLTGLGGRGFDAGVRWKRGRLANAIPPAGPRDAFLCAHWDGDAVTVLDRQEASSQWMLAHANALVRHTAGHDAAAPGAHVAFLSL